MPRKVSIVGIQVTPTADRERNLKQALELLDEAASLYQYIDMIVLPEYFYFLPTRKVSPSIGAYPQEIIDVFSARAKKYNTYIVSGTVSNKRADGKIYNTAMLFDRNGEVIGSYDKIHLFDALNAMGGENESDLTTRGDHVLMHDADFGKIGVMVCYDIRFPELSRTLALAGVQYLFVPSGFFSPRFDHWQDLIRVTAVQNSMVVTGVNLFGKLNDANVFCGRSLIADPWGIAVATAPDKPGLIQAYIDDEHASKIKDAVGTFHNRVPSVYDIK